MTAGPRGGDLCSAASLTMVLQYWAGRTGDERLRSFAGPDATERITTPAIYDSVYDGAGNWSFNVAFATSLGLEAYVARFDALAELMPWLEAGVPIIASVSWQQGELDGAPLPRSSGHLLVVTGFTADGDAIVNDPRADIRCGEPVRRVYRHDQFERAWHRRSHGAVYLIYPPSSGIAAPDAPSPAAV